MEMKSKCVHELLANAAANFLFPDCELFEKQSVSMPVSAFKLFTIVEFFSDFSGYFPGLRAR